MAAYSKKRTYRKRKSYRKKKYYKKYRKGNGGGGGSIGSLPANGGFLSRLTGTSKRTLQQELEDKLMEQKISLLNGAKNIKDKIEATGAKISIGNAQQIAQELERRKMPIKPESLESLTGMSLDVFAQIYPTPTLRNILYEFGANRKNMKRAGFTPLKQQV